MTEPSSSLESASVTAMLVQRSREDHGALLDDLVAMLAELVPGVEIQRALIRRHVTAVRLPLGGYVYLLKRTSKSSFEASRQQIVRGVAIRTEPMDIERFLADLGPALDAELRRTERGQAALKQWLASAGP